MDGRTWLILPVNFSKDVAVGEERNSTCTTTNNLEYRALTNASFSLPNAFFHLIGEHLPKWVEC